MDLLSEIGELSIASAFSFCCLKACKFPRANSAVGSTWRGVFMCRPTFRCSKSVGLGSAMLNVGGSLRRILLPCRWRQNILAKRRSLYELCGAYRRSQRVWCHCHENLQSAFLRHSVSGASCKFLPSLLSKDLLHSISAGSNCAMCCVSSVVLLFLLTNRLSLSICSLVLLP